MTAPEMVFVAVAAVVLIAGLSASIYVICTSRPPRWQDDPAIRRLRRIWGRD